MNKAVTNLKPEAEVSVDPLALLRKPFPSHQISKLPKETGAQAKQRKADQEAGKWPSKCSVCEGYHHPKAVHLDYVGHAALTDRLLDADPHWSWEPVATDPNGLPLFDRNGGLWIRLTVCDVTRLGYGNAPGKEGGDAVKEIIGDALRNAAMRFGAALDLWHKGDLHAGEETEGEADAKGEAEEDAPGPDAVTFAAAQAAKVSIEMCRDLPQIKKWKADNEDQLAAFPSEVADEIVRAFNARYAELKAATKPANGHTPPPKNDFGLAGDDVPQFN